MLIEEERHILEDLERLEEGIVERLGDEPKQIRDRLNRDHEIAQLLEQIQRQSKELLSAYTSADEQRSQELQQISAGDPFEEFYRLLTSIRDHHARYPNEQAENAEARYRPRRDGDPAHPFLVDSMFSGEEAYGRFFDLHEAHEAFVNLPGAKRVTYLQYLEVFDRFAPGAGAGGSVRPADRLTDQYFRYVGDLAAYLESFMRRTRPLEDLERAFTGFDADFATAWEEDKIHGWESAPAKKAAVERTLSSAEAAWCEACEKEFKNENVYKGHLSGRKHVKAAEQLALQQQESANGNRQQPGSAHRLKERAVAEREYRVTRLAGAMSTEREDTRRNVERRQGMTERERQQELDNLYNSTGGGVGYGYGGSGGAGPGTRNADAGDDGDDGDEERIYNPLKLPLAWDGKPIPFWLYRLHGLGVEFPCEICGNFVYMGRRAFDKHFNEARHIYGLKCLGISNTHLFRDITDINEALRLWEKIQRDEKRGRVDDDTVVQMEDADGNVMPEKVYYDLQKQGIL